MVRKLITTKLKPDKVMALGAMDMGKHLMATLL